MGKRAAKLDAALTRVVEELRKGPCSARDLAPKLSCSKPTVYAWIEQLKARGVPVVETPEREGARGPKAVVFSLTLPEVAPS
jgi:biotin operon repressor